MSVRLPRYRRVADYPEIPVGRAKHQLLLSIAAFSYLSSFQLTRLLYSDASLKYVQAHLKQLYQAGYVRRVFLPTLTSQGSARAFYTLDIRGYRWLKSLGLSPEGRFKATEQAEREWFLLKHTEAANDLIILAHALAKQDPTVRLAQFRTERELKRTPARLQVGKEQVAVVPDGWMDLRKRWPGLDRSAQYGICFELDRDTSGQKQVIRKVQALAAYITGPYQQQFGTQSVTLAYVTTGGEAEA